RSHENIAVLSQPPNTGYARAFNVGIEHACTERVGFLLSDDWLSELAVSACLKFSTDIVSTGLVIFDACGKKRIADRRVDLSQFLALPSLEAKASYLKHFLLFKKERLLEVGGVDETIGRTGPDDYDLVWTLLECGATVAVTGYPCYNYRDHFGQRLSLRSREDQVRDLQKILDKHGVNGDERKAVIARRASWYGAPIQVTMKRKSKSNAEKANGSDSASGNL
ncbi:MAG: hypothetical protein OEU36_11545, partial [Gammaproteobacteria bacterium]|nr:hypothetical protein [Gammaproteobacteria bacterium]